MHNVYIVMSFMALFGFLIFPVMPTMMELLTRKYPDVPLHVSNTFMVVVSQLVTVLLQSMCGYVFDRAEHSGQVVLLLVLVFLSSSLFFVTKIDQKRPENISID